MARIAKTVFISYRRLDIAWALAVFQNLTHYGFDVFFDYSGIASGDFERVILENIKARAHFIVLLTPGALDRCSDPADMFRREIEAALGSQRNIVPLMLEGFDFSTPKIASQLTGTLAALKRYNGLPIHAAYFDEAMVRLREKYLNVPLETVLHPVSPFAEQAAKEQQQAAARTPAVVPEPPAPNQARPRPAAEPPRRAVRSSRKRWLIRVGVVAVPLLAVVIASFDNWPEYLLRSELGDTHAMEVLAYEYDVGRGVRKDQAKSVYWLHKAAERGNVSAMSSLASTYNDGCCGLTKSDSQVQAAGWYRKAAERGDAYSMFRVGYMYEHGEGGLPKDDSQALGWYRKAADAGDGSARFFIGIAYEDGSYGLPKSDSEAVNWYRSAAETGNEFAMYRLGLMYEQGRGGLAKDVDQAVNWYYKAKNIDREAEAALKRLGRL